MKKIIITLLGLTILIRLLGINYGLPLWAIGDEPSNILGALKMIEVKSLIPALHPEDFKGLLYYPPYLSYLYLPIFMILGGIEAVFHLITNGTLQGFTLSLSADPSIFFIGARFLQIAFACLSVFFVFDTARRYYRSITAGVISSILLITSPLHIALSVGARPWLAVSTAVAFILWILTKGDVRYEKRILLSILAAGFAVGVNTLGALAFLLIPMWHFIGEKKTLQALIKLWPYGLMSLGLLALPRLLHYQSNGFTVDLTTQSTKTLAGLIASPYDFYIKFFIAEPVFFLLAIIGIWLGLRKIRPLELLTGIIALFYPVIFFFLFRYESRFILPLLPLFAMSAGSIANIIPHSKNYFRNISFGVLALLVTLPLSGMLLTLTKNDSRISALEYSQKELPGRKIAHDIELFRFPSTKQALTEQQSYDPTSMRRADLAELNINRTKETLIHSFSINTLKERDILRIISHMRDHQFEFFLVEDSRITNYQQLSLTPIQTFGDQETFSLTHSEPKGNFFKITSGKQSGPQITLYKINW